jgi:hypothetical protein
VRGTGRGTVGALVRAAGGVIAEIREETRRGPRVRRMFTLWPERGVAVDRRSRAGASA